EKQVYISVQMVKGFIIQLLAEASYKRVQKAVSLPSAYCLLGDRAVFRLVLEGAELGEEHAVGLVVLGVVLEDGPLEILHCVGLAVRGADLLHLAGDGEALLGQAAVTTPVVEEEAPDRLAGLGALQGISAGG